ncbi:Hypothetical protein MVR_LOCUS78 [uncultured virus]|nr:Hypothetical protein MVR_LOCUS78 [uncultured virus]
MEALIKQVTKLLTHNDYAKLTSSFEVRNGVISIKDSNYKLAGSKLRYLYEVEIGGLSLYHDLKQLEDCPYLQVVILSNASGIAWSFEVAGDELIQFANITMLVIDGLYSLCNLYNLEHVFPNIETLVIRVTAANWKQIVPFTLNLAFVACVNLVIFSYKPIKGSNFMLQFISNTLINKPHINNLLMITTTYKTAMSLKGIKFHNPINLFTRGYDVTGLFKCIGVKNTDVSDFDI